MKGMVTYRGPQDFGKIADLRGTERGINIADYGSMFITKKIPPKFLHIVEFLSWYKSADSKAVHVCVGDVLTIRRDGSAFVTSRRK